MKGILILPIVAVLVSSASSRIVQKRQIYREQVLPHAGGKIPDTAFQTDRLFLNHLQKEGISIPDGIILEQRNPQVYPFLNKQMRTVYKVALSSDGRFTSEVGRYHTEYPSSVDTTYLVPQIHNHPDQVLPNAPAYPVYRQLQIQNPLLNQPKFQPKKKSLLYISQYHNKNYGNGPEKIKVIKPEGHAINLLNDPFNTLSDNVFVQNQEVSHLFNEFDNLFNGLQLDSMRSYQFKMDRRTSKKMKI